MLIELQSGPPLLFQKFRTVIFAYLMTDVSCLHKVKIRLSKFLKFLKADQNGNPGLQYSRNTFFVAFLTAYLCWVIIL